MDQERESKATISIGKRPVEVQFLDEKLRRIWSIIGIMLIIAGALTAFVILKPFIAMVIKTAMPFAAGLVFAYIFDPIVTFVQKRLRLSRIGGVTVLYFLFLVVITIFFAVMLPILIGQVKSAYTGIAQFLSDQLNRIAQVVGEKTGESSTGDVRQLWVQAQAWLVANGIVIEDLFTQAAQSEEVRSAAQTAASSSVHVVGSALTFVFSVLLSIFGSVSFLIFAVLVNIYLLLDFSKLGDVMEVIIPAKKQKQTFEVLGKVDVAVGGFIRGMLIDAFLVGLLTFIGLWALGLRQYALIIGVIAGVGNFVPYLGPLMGAIPALLFVIFSQAYETAQERLLYGVLVVILFSVIQAIEGFVFQPKIVGKSAQLHPIAVLFALAFGANFGLFGMILAVPVACIVRVLIKELYWDKLEASWKNRSGKKYLGDWKSRHRKKSKAA